MAPVVIVGSVVTVAVEVSVAMVLVVSLDFKKCSRFCVVLLMLANNCGDWPTVEAPESVLPPPHAASVDARTKPPAAETRSLLDLLLNTENS